MSEGGSTIRGVQVGPHNQQFNVEHHYHGAAVDGSERIVVGYAPVADPSNLERPALRSAVDAAVTKPGAAPIVVLSGGAGTGKTQLAAAVFAAALEDGAELAIWASAASRTSVVAAYAQAYAELRAGRVNFVAVDAEPTAERLLGWLRTATQKWIVVLDDVTDAGDLRNLVPEGPAGRVVITSRLRADALAGRGHVVEVAHFTEQEATAYVGRRLDHRGRATERVLAEAAQLAEALGHLPLALSVATTYLLDQGLTCAQYREMLTDPGLALQDLLDARPPSAADYGGSPIRAWQLSLERADLWAPAGVAAPLMELIALGDANGIPEELLLSDAARRHLSASAAAPALTRATARQGLRNLHNLHLVTHDPDRGPVQIRTHRLNQRATLEAVSPVRVAEAVRVIADGLVEVWPDGHHDLALAAALRANTEAIMAERWDSLWDGGAHPVLFRAGLSLGEVGLVAAARDHFARMARTATEKLGGDHRDHLAARHNHAHYQGLAGDAAQAALDLRGLLTTLVRILGPEHPDTLAATNELVYWLAQAGHPNEALAVAESLLADQLRLGGPDNVESLRTRGSAAYALGQAGNPVAAVAAFEKLLADEERILDAEDIEVLITRNQLAAWRGQTGDVSGALEGFRSLVADGQRILGPDHPHTLIARHNLAHWKGEAGQIAEAVRDCEQLLEDRLRVLGPDHPHTVSTRNNLGHWYGVAGDPALAARFFEDLLPDRRRVLGADHPLTLTTRNDLAWWTGCAGDWPRAVADLAELHRDELTLLGKDHLDTLVTANNLALCRAAAGEPAQASADLETTVAQMVRALGPAHPHTMAARNNLACLQAQLGLHTAAIGALRAVLDDETHLLGPDHRHTRATRANLERLSSAAPRIAGRARRRAGLGLVGAATIVSLVAAAGVLGAWAPAAVVTLQIATAACCAAALLALRPAPARTSIDPAGTGTIYLRGARGIQVGDGNTRLTVSRSPATPAREPEPRTDVVAGYLAARTLRRSEPRGEGPESDLDAGLDRLHSVVSGKLGTDPAIAKLETEVAAEPTAAERTRRRVRDAIDDACEQDAAFATTLQRILAELDDARRAAPDPLPGFDLRGAKGVQLGARNTQVNRFG